MDRQDRIDLIIDHYEHPRHYGPMDEPTVTQKGGNPGCGDVVTFYLKIDRDARIADISFEGEGCTISQAASSMVTEMLLGRTVDEAERISAEEVLDVLGREIAGTRPKCATLGLNTTKEALRKARSARA